MWWFYIAWFGGYGWIMFGKHLCDISRDYKHQIRPINTVSENRYLEEKSNMYRIYGAVAMGAGLMWVLGIATLNGLGVVK